MSLVDVLSHWFVIVDDYPRQSSIKPKPIERFPEYFIVCGHYYALFDVDSKHRNLFERYPVCLQNKDYRLISFVREPLDLAVSGYFYGKQRKLFNPCEITLEEHLLSHDNFMAKSLGCDEHNYQDIVDRSLNICRSKITPPIQPLL